VGIATVWLVIGLVVQIGYGPLLQSSREAHFQAARLVARDPLISVSEAQMKVIHAVDPHFENDSLLEFMREKTDRNQVNLAQASFDGIAEIASSTLNQHPFRRLGLAPTETNATGFATHVWLHEGFLHLFASLLLFLLAAPLLERRWGPWVLALNSSLIVLAGAAAYVFAHPDSQRALIGGSALVAGLVAAVVIREKGQPVNFLGWLSPFVNAKLIAPGWAIGGVWLVYEASLWVIAQGALPRGVDNAVGYSAHAAGALLGGGLAMLLAMLGAEKIDAPSSTKTAGTKARKSPRFDLDRALELKSSGDQDAAFFMLEGEVERSARNRDVVMAYWDMAVERQQVEQAAPVLVRLIEEEMRRGAEVVAGQLWKTLNEHAPRVLLSAATLIRLIPSLAREQGEEEVAVALRQAIDEENRELTPLLAASAARMAVEVDTRLASQAARIALSAEDLDEKTRSEMKMLVAALAPNKPGESDPKQKAPPPPNAFFEESDRSAFGEVGDLSEMASESFPDGAITLAVPLGASAEGLRIQIEGRDPSVVAYSRMRALSIVGVHSLAPKPIVLFDILIDGSGDSHPLSLLRMRCDRFDPRVLVPKAVSTKSAMRAIVNTLRKKGLKVLADITAQTPDAKPVFESVDAYHDKVIRPVAQRFA
jgi:membrane associated rhomboid family serine protease